MVFNVNLVFVILFCFVFHVFSLHSCFIIRFFYRTFQIVTVSFIHGSKDKRKGFHDHYPLKHYTSFLPKTVIWLL